MPPKYMGLSGRPLSLMVSCIATSGFMLFGYDQGVMSGIITAPAFSTVLAETRGNSTMQGFVTAIFEIGCLVGAAFIIWAGDSLGRRKAIIIGVIVMIVGVVIQVTSYPGHQPLAQFVIGRIITGVGNGINTSTIPTYQAECSKSTNRGLLICIEGGVVAIGTMVAYWIDYGASYGSDDLVWRFPIAFQCFFCVCIAIGMFFLPDSPRWLFMRERYDEGERVIAALRGVEVSDRLVQIEKATVLDSLRASGAGGKTTPLSAVFTNGKTQHLRRMLLGASGQFMQQIGGCNAVIYYFPILFQESIKESHNMSLLMGGVNMIVYSIFATTSWFLIERVGRRKLFLIGAAGQSLSMVITFSCLIKDNTSNAKGAAVGLFTFIAFFGATWLPLPWLYPAEISPIKTRAKANALSTCTNWLWNFVIVMVTPVMIANIGWGTYLFFACVNACFIPVVYLFYPETAGRSLEEIDIIFAKGFTDGNGYVRAAKELPFLSPEEVEEMAVQYGFAADQQQAVETKDGEFGTSKEVESQSGSQSGSQ